MQVLLETLEMQESASWLTGIVFIVSCFLDWSVLAGLFCCASLGCVECWCSGNTAWLAGRSVLNTSKRGTLALHKAVSNRSSGLSRVELHFPCLCLVWAPRSLLAHLCRPSEGSIHAARFWCCHAMSGSTGSWWSQCYPAQPWAQVPSIPVSHLCSAYPAPAAQPPPTNAFTWLPWTEANFLT